MHHVRPLCPDDAAAAAAVIHAAFAAQEVATDPPPGALKESAASVRILVEAGGGAAAVDADGRMLAVVLWREAEGGLYFGRLAVLPAARGQGIARTLIAAAEDEARRRGLRRVHCGARLVLAGNHRLFRSCGYREFRRPYEAKYGGVVSADLEKHL